MQVNQVYSSILIVFSLINLIFSIFMWKKQGLKKESLKYYFFLSLAISAYAFGYSQEILQVRLDKVKFWLRFQYLGGAFVPSLWLIVVLELSGHIKLLNKNAKKLLIGLGLLVLVIFYTNDYHKLYYVKEYLVNYDNFYLINTEKGFLYMVFVFFELMCNFYVFYVSLNILSKENYHIKRQFSMLLIASIFMGGAFFINMTAWGPYPFDYLPIASIIFQLFVGLSLFRYGLINYAPVAYDFVIKNMKEGLLVVDREGIVVNYNTAFQTISNIHRKSIGKSIEDFEIYKQGLKKFFDNKILYTLDKEPLNCQIGDKHYKVNYTLVGEKAYVYAWVFLFYDVTQELEYIKKMEYYATYDALTGLLNRRAFYEEGTKELDESKTFSAIVFDFDHFKMINDTFSHDAGDMVLAHFGKRIKDYTDERGLLAGRLGGEEFAITLSNRDLEEASIVAEEIREIIEREALPYEDFILTITGSFGVAQGREGEELKNILKRADRALYGAKELGRNRVELYM